MLRRPLAAHPNRSAFRLSSLAIALALTPAAAHAATSLGEVQAQASTASPGGTGHFFLQAPAVTVDYVPAAELAHVQQFTPTATQAQTRITAGQLRQLNPTASFTQALNNMPNVVVVSSGDSQNGDNVYINGFNKSLVDWTPDGIPLNDNDNYTIYTNEFIPTELIGSIGYLPGAGSAAIPGVAAFGGSVNLYSVNPSARPSATLYTGAGSFGKYNGGLLVNSGLLGGNTGAPTALWFYANKNHSDGYFDNTPSDQKQYLFKSISQIGPGALTLFYTQNNQDFGYYGGCTAADLAQYGERCNSYRGAAVVGGKYNAGSPDFHYNQYQNWLGYVKYEATLGSTTVSDQVYYYRGNGFGGGASSAASSRLLLPGGTVASVASGGLFVTHGINSTRRVGNLFKLLTPLGADLGLEAGLWYNQNDTRHDSQYFPYATGQYAGSSYVEPVSTRLTEPYAQLTYRATPALTLQGGLKYLSTTRDFTNLGALAQGKTGNFHTDFSTLMPSLGVNYRIADGLNVYANYTQNSEPPAYNQFYSGSFNPNLDPQKARLYDAGAIWKRGAWNGQLDVFRVDFQNYILSNNVVIAGVNSSQLQNAGTALNEGVAWQNNLQLTRALALYANLGLLNAHIDTKNSPFPYAPRHTLALGGVWTQGPWRFALGANYVGESYYVFSNYATAPVQAHAIGTADLRYTVAPHALGLQQLVLDLNVDNLFDKRYDVSYGGSSSNPYIYANLPRNVYLSLQARF